jgi:hypothetical protein
MGGFTISDRDQDMVLRLLEEHRDKAPQEWYLNKQEYFALEQLIARLKKWEARKEETMR